MSKLYIVSIPGPDEWHAAPSYRAAQLMKEHHDKCMTEWLATQHANGQMLCIHDENVIAVIEECDDPEEHADMLAKFSYSDWGITEADPVEPEDASQRRLFMQGGSAT